GRADGTRDRAPPLRRPRHQRRDGAPGRAAPCRNHRRDQQESQGADPEGRGPRGAGRRARAAAAPRSCPAAVTLPASPDVLVVGGGVIGCAIARLLARSARSVLLVDRGAIGGESSTAAAGVLSVGSGDAAGSSLALRRAGLERFPALADALRDETGIDVELHLDGVAGPAPDRGAGPGPAGPAARSA